MHKAFVVLSVALALVAALSASGSGAEEVAGTMRQESKAEWKAIDKDISEQRIEAAKKKLETLRARAQKEGREEDWARALVKLVELQVGRGGYETAVRFLREQPWPKGLLPHAALDLYYGQTLITYLKMHGWEINNREAVAAKGVVDLKAWSRDQIVAEAMKAFESVWQRRVALGQHKVGAFSAYLTLNNYPSGIRDNLRDAVSYLAVNALADSSLWTPTESNEQFRLDFGALLAGRGPSGQTSGKASVTGTAHPLVRVGAVLDDLEAWATEQGRPEAALEARLERVRRLRGPFRSREQQAALRDHLSKLLPRYRKHAWWGMGQALLGELWQGEDKARAHALASEGATAFPRSPGAASCLAIQKQLEAPQYQLEAMSSDGPGKRSLLVTHRNLAQLHFRAWRLDLGQHLQNAKGGELLMDGPALQKLVRGATRPVAAWSAPLPATPDFQSHKTFLAPPRELTAGGWYVVVASVRPDFVDESNQMMGVNFIVTDLVLVTGTDESGGAAVRVVSGASGQPVAGAEVELWRNQWDKAVERLESKKTGGDGLVTFGPRKETATFVVAHTGKDGGKDIAIDTDPLYLSSPSRSEPIKAALVYTDRSIYRPTQKLYFKVLVYRGQSGGSDFKVAPDQTLTMTLRDANGQEVERRTVKTNEYGSAAGEFVLPGGRLLGSWNVESSWNGVATVQVEEYKRPSFELGWKPGGEAMRLNRPAVLQGEAHHYFGTPVTAGTVRWRVTRVPVYPRWWWWVRGGESQSQQIAAGSATLGADGSFAVKFTPVADEKAGKEVSYRYQVSADLTDEGGETRSASKTVRLGFVAVDATIASDVGFLRAQEPGAVSITRTDLDGQPRAGKGSWRVLELKQPSPRLPADEPVVTPPADATGEGQPKFHTPGDVLRARWEPADGVEVVMGRWSDGAERGAGNVEHGADGKGELKLPSLPAGAYRLRYQTVDEFGARFTTFKDLIVAGDKTPLSIPAAMLVRSPSVPVGDRARIFVHGGLPAQALFFERFRAGVLIERKSLVAADGEVIEIPVTEADRGGFSVALTAVRDHQVIRRAQSIMVPWDNKELEIALASFRDRLRPGQKETWRITVKGPKGAKLEQRGAEVLAYMYDRSLDLFGPHEPPSPLSLYPWRGEAFESARTSLGRASVLGVSSHTWFELPRPPSFHGELLPGQGGYGGIGRGFAGESVMMRSMAAAPAPFERAKMKAPSMDAEATLEGASGGKPESLVARRGPSGLADKPVASAQPPQVRSNFAETAFFQPQLLTDRDGSVAIEFAVPDSVTSWNVWLHALTKDLRSGSKKVEARTVKELMVRPYLPRFWREKDQSVLKVVVNNAGDGDLSGQMQLDIVDPETQESKLGLFGITDKKDAVRPFKVAKGQSTSVSFPLTAPAAVGSYAFKVVASAGNFSDGELRPVPVLPSRLHLMQSRFVTLRDADKREMKFDDLARNDDTTRSNEQMVVTVDAQLFTTALKALPYLINYPYECTEQTLNRFVSTGILTSLYRQYPGIAKMAGQLSQRQTRLETFDAVDPNRKLALEETPFLVESKGGGADKDDVINVLDGRVARANRDQALAKLRKLQMSSGAFPWFPGGPPSPYMTLYLLAGLAHAAEFGVEVPKDVVTRGWSYLGHYWSEEKAKWAARKCCAEFATFLNYVASSYPDPSWVGDALTEADQKELLDASYARWKQLPPRLKGYLALTLFRHRRAVDAKRVFASVMDAAKTLPDQGTFWTPEDRAWLWYEDTIESHAFALRVLSELDPKNPKRDGLVLWLMLNKKLNHWKSTRATAEVLYALAHYLKHEGSLSVREEAKVSVGATSKSFEFPPDVYLGKAQLVLPGASVSGDSAKVTVEKATKGLLFASATWHFSTDKLPAEDRGDFFVVSRKYFKRVNDGQKYLLQPLAEGAKLAAGDEVEVQLSLRSTHAAEYVHLRDPRAAGLEPEAQVSGWHGELGIGWYQEVRDSGANFFFEQLPAGEYTFKYRLRANMSGTFRVGPATVQSMYAPEFAGYSAGHVVQIQ